MGPDEATRCVAQRSSVQFANGVVVRPDLAPAAGPDQRGTRPRARPHPVVALVCGVVALGLLAWLPTAAAADPSLGDVPGGASAGWWTAAAVLTVQSVLVTWVAVRPRVLLPVVAGLPLVLASATPATVTLSAVAVVAAAYLAVSSTPLRRLVPALAVTTALVASGQVVSQALDVQAGGRLWVGLAAGVAQALVVVGVPTLLGSVVAARREAEHARRQEVAALRREQEALLAAAVSQQRTAMSRELHDIAAHHLSGIALLAAAIGRQVDDDPAAAKRSAQLVREQSRAVLDDLRRLVGLLREDVETARPVETLAGLAALVASRRQAGMDVDLVVEPDDEPAWSARVGPLAQLVAHRMVQECLANAAVHAPGARCVVEVLPPAGGRVVVGVRNGPPVEPDPGHGSGFGLVAMAERAQLVGGDLAYGATDDGGWQVRLSLPVEPAADREDADVRTTEHDQQHQHDQAPMGLA